VNERIRLLAKQADPDYTGNGDIDMGDSLVGNYAIEKFAELLIGEYAEELRQLNDGERVVLPKDREHAQAMVRVGMSYLEQNK